MEIQIERVSDGIEVKESVIRDIAGRRKWRDDEKSPIPHLQMRVITTKPLPPNLIFDIAYYSAAGEFMGLDQTTSEYAGNWVENLSEDGKWYHEQFSLDKPLDIPEGVETVKIIVSRERQDAFWHWSKRIFAILFMLLIVSWIWSAFTG